MDAERDKEPEADNNDKEEKPQEGKEEPPKLEEGEAGKTETAQEIQEMVEPTSEPRSVQEQEHQEQELDSSSIIEMEVDDSNTGDTITSNPEIDLGSAAAAATAVIMEEPENEGDKSGDEVTIVEENVVEVKDAEEIEEISEFGVAPPLETGTGEKETKKEEEQAEIREIILDGPAETQEQETAPQVVTLEDESEEEKGMERPGISSPDEIMEMDISQNEPETGDDVVPFDSEMDGDGNQHMVGEADADVLEVEQDKAFLNEEESLSSLPEDAAETDKENNDLICDDQNDDGEDDYLEITRRRISQDREGNCYCGKDRNFNIAELLCASCYRWFHESCISYQLGKLVPFTTNYVFTCKNCSMTGLECFKRNQAQFSQMCVTALANLTQASSKEGTNIKLFSKDRDIIPFFEIHWEALTTTTRRVTQSWHSTVTKTLMKDAGIVYSCQEIPGDEYSPYFGLLSDDLSTIRPNYEAMIKAGQLKVTDQRNSSASLRGRGAKRRTVQDPSNVVQSQIAKKPRGDNFGPKPVIGHGYPTEHPFNKDSYRYILAEPDPNAPFRQEFDESNEWSGKPIHGWLCRVVNPPCVLLALHDRATQLKVSEDRLSVTGDKGYCMIRATHSVNRGSWYFEAKITDMPEGSASRIGFCQQFGNLQGPLGFDRYGYSWRSRYGTAFHEARGKSYAKGGYGLDDVLGFMIVLPDDKKVPLVPTSFKDRPLVKVKSHLYYEDKDDPKELERRDLRKKSKIICFKNGVCQGIMYSDIYCGNYYPAISVYKSITVRCNFGPDFWAPPSPSEFEYRGMCERAEDATIEQTMADMLYLTENDGQLHLDNAVPLPM